MTLFGSFEEINSVLDSHFESQLLPSSNLIQPRGFYPKLLFVPTTKWICVYRRRWCKSYTCSKFIHCQNYHAEKNKKIKTNKIVLLIKIYTSQANALNLIRAKQSDFDKKNNNNKVEAFIFQRTYFKNYNLAKLSNCMTNLGMI